MKAVKKCILAFLFLKIFFCHSHSSQKAENNTTSHINFHPAGFFWPQSCHNNQCKC